MGLVSTPHFYGGEMKKRQVRKKPSKLKFDEFPLVLEPPGFVYQWCCQCGSRHAWYFALTEKDNLWIDCGRDEMGEKLRKFYEKKEKEA